jgi:hypothetical protein
MLRFFGLVLFLIANVSSAQAATKLFDFVARVDQSNMILPPGTVFSGQFGYDSAATPTQIFTGPESIVALYESDSIFVNVTFGGSSYRSQSAYAGVNNQYAGTDEDNFGVNGSTGRFGMGLQFNAADGNLNLYSNTSLPQAFPSNLWQGPYLGGPEYDDIGFEYATFSFFNTTANQGFEALVLSISPTVSAVPEPTTWAMMIFGFGLIGANLRRKTRVAIFN